MKSALLSACWLSATNAPGAVPERSIEKNHGFIGELLDTERGNDGGPALAVLQSA